MNEHFKESIEVKQGRRIRRNLVTYDDDDDHQIIREVQHRGGYCLEPRYPLAPKTDRAAPSGSSRGKPHEESFHPRLSSTNHIR